MIYTLISNSKSALRKRLTEYFNFYQFYNPECLKIYILYIINTRLTIGQRTMYHVKEAACGDRARAQTQRAKKVNILLIFLRWTQT